MRPCTLQSCRRDRWGVIGTDHNEIRIFQDSLKCRETIDLMRERETTDNDGRPTMKERMGSRTWTRPRLKKSSWFNGDDGMVEMRSAMSKTSMLFPSVWREREREGERERERV
jgi:hypothetical protein